MKNALLTGIIAMCAACPAAAAAQDLDGFYIGGELGQAAIEGRFNDEPLSALRARASQTESGFAYGVFGGWGSRLIGPVYVGVELGIGAGGKDVARTINTARVRLDPQERYTFSARLGYQFSNRSLLYVRGGYEARQFEATLPDGRKREEDFGGGLVGLGYEHLVAERFSLRGEVIGVANKDLDLRYGPANASRIKVEAQEARFMLGGAYRF